MASANLKTLAAQLGCHGNDAEAAHGFARWKHQQVLRYTGTLCNTDVVDELPTLLERGVVPTEFHQHYKQLYDQQKKAASGTTPEWSPAELLDLFTCFEMGAPNNVGGYLRFRYGHSIRSKEACQRKREDLKKKLA